MSDTETEAEALGRLEAALDRIADRAHTAPTVQTPAVDTKDVALRLDRLIGQLRDALSDEAEAEA